MNVMMREGGVDSTGGSSSVNPSLVAYVTLMRNGIDDEGLKEAENELRKMYEDQDNVFTGLILYWREVRGKSKGEELLCGSQDVQVNLPLFHFFLFNLIQKCILMNKKFKISPSSFFQTHYKQCERLYNLLADWSLEFTGSWIKQIKQTKHNYRRDKGTVSVRHMLRNG